ncbi:hypothetical protein C0J52_01153 [Blattella germanica]|nr:hypothetical protein C0J52_01153 [Blattella germanica]
MVWCPELLIMENNTLPIMWNDSLTPCGDTIVNMSLRNCGIEEIHVGVFADFYKLLFLDLRYNKVKKIHENLFIGMTSIIDVYFQHNEIQEYEMSEKVSYEPEDNPIGTLYLGNNKMTRFEGGVPRGFKFLNVTDNPLEEIVPGTAVFPLLSVDTVFFNRNKIKVLRRRAFCGFVNESWFRNEDSPLQLLQRIVLDDNLIEAIEPFAFEGLPVINSIDMSGNRLKTLTQNMFMGLLDLSQLTIANSNVEDIQLEAFRDLDGLKFLNLSHNKISTLRTDVFLDMPFVEKIDLSFNKLREVRKEMFVGLNETKLFNLSYNQIKVVRTASFKGMQKVEVLDLSHNLIVRTEKDAFINMSTLDTLILDHNRMVRVQPLSYRDIPRLRELRFKFNRIRTLSPKHDEQVNVLRTDLYLRGNTIEVPEPKDVMKLKNLAVLDLTHNELEELPPGVFRGVPGLFSLRLGHNKMKYLRERALVGLRRLYELDLHGNPIRCDCNMVGIWVYATLNKIDTKVFSDDDLTCRSPLRHRGKSWHEILMQIENSTACEPLKPLGAGNQAGLFVLGPILLVIIGANTRKTSCLWLRGEYRKEELQRNPDVNLAILLKDGFDGHLNVNTFF